MPKKKTAEELIEELAVMVARGFADTASKAELTSLRDELRQGFAAVEQRLDRVEYLLTGHERRISILEDHLRQVATKIGLNLN